MLPFVLIVRLLSFFVPGLEPLALICALGALLGMHEDKNRDEAYERAEAVGYDMGGDRAWDFVGDLVLGFLFLLPFLVYFGVIGGG